MEEFIGIAEPILVVLFFVGLLGILRPTWIGFSNRSSVLEKLISPSLGALMIITLVQPPDGRLKPTPQHTQEPTNSHGFEYWGEYRAGNWDWKVVIIPETTSTGELIDIGKRIHRKYPKTRVRLFNDNNKYYINQYIARDKYFWDKTLVEATYPEEWIKAHHVANINDRSDSEYNKWQIVTIKGQNIYTLD